MSIIGDHSNAASGKSQDQAPQNFNFQSDRQGFVYFPLAYGNSTFKEQTIENSLIYE